MRLLAVMMVRNPPQGGRLWLASRTLYPLIRLFTRSRWNHVAMRVRMEEGEHAGREMILEAIEGGVTLTPLEEWRVRAVRTTCTLPLEKNISFMLDYIGCRYDYASLFGWKLLKIITGRWWGPRFEKAAVAITCSELVWMALEKEEPWDKTPQDVFMLLRHPATPLN